MASYDETSITSAKLILGDNHLNIYMDKSRMMDNIIASAIENVKYVLNVPILRKDIQRSFSGDFNAHFPLTRREIVPFNELMSLIDTVKLSFMHSPRNTGLKIHNRLHALLTEIVCNSHLEYDIHMAYILRYFITFGLMGNSKYTWSEKTLIFSFIVCHIPFIHSAHSRTKTIKGRNCVAFSQTLVNARETINGRGIMGVVMDQFKPKLKAF